MDKYDRALLAALIDNGRLTFAELARRINLSPPAVADRVAKLEAEGVITGYHASVNLAKLGLPIDGFVALSFGLLRPYKGIGDIIRAFQKVARDQDRLILAGNPQGDVSADLELAREDPRILVCAKRISKDDVPLYFAAADGAVIAHRGFFTSGSALLALSMGCPVIGPEVNHLVDLAGEQRLYPVELGVDGLAMGLAEARAQAGTVDRESMRSWAGSYSSWSEAAARTAAVFRDGADSH